MGNKLNQWAEGSTFNNPLEPNDLMSYTKILQYDIKLYKIYDFEHKTCFVILAKEDYVCAIVNKKQ